MFWRRHKSPAPSTSLLRGLGFDLLVLQVIGLVVLVWVVIDRLDTTIDDLEAEDMHKNALDLADRLESGGLSDIDLESSDLARFSPAYGRYLFAVVGNDGRVLFSSVKPGRALAPIDSANPGHTARFKTSNGASLLWGVTVEANLGKRHVWIQVAEDMNHRDAVLDEVAVRFLERGGGLILALSVAQIVFALIRMQRRIRPLLSASASVEAIGPDIGPERINCDGVPSEILPLVFAVNSAFDRLGIAFRAQKEFLENAAHELRTPLSVLRARVETIDNALLRQELETDIAVLSRLVTQLLRAAEMEGLAGNDPADIDLLDLTETVASYLFPAAAMSGRSINVGGDADVIVRGCAETIGQAINNLVENALFHTPLGTGIDIRVIGGDCPEIRVRDHGPGVPPEARQLIFQRFWRSDRSKGNGAGLGLSMVRRAMDLHHGTATVEDAPGGGAVFILRFGNVPSAA